jgi:hypothetical protein
MLKTAITGLETLKRWSVNINKIPSASACNVFSEKFKEIA